EIPPAPATPAAVLTSRECGKTGKPAWRSGSAASRPRHKPRPRERRGVDATRATRILSLQTPVPLSQQQRCRRLRVSLARPTTGAGTRPARVAPSSRNLQTGPPALHRQPRHQHSNTPAAQCEPDPGAEDALETMDAAGRPAAMR